MEIRFDLTAYNHWLEKGLCAGGMSGSKLPPEPLQSDERVCIEQAIALACGYALTDKPDMVPGSCIASVLPQFKRILNDARWSSYEARAQGLRELGLEQVGSNGIDEMWFADQLIDRFSRTILPDTLRLLDGPPEMRRRLGEEADRLVASGMTGISLADARPLPSVIYRSLEDCQRASHAVSPISKVAHLAEGMVSLTSYFSVDSGVFLRACADLALTVLREAKQRTGLPLFAELDLLPLCGKG